MNKPKYQLTCTVTPSYIPEQSSPSDSVYGFAYRETITNTGSVAAQLISRHWEIVDANGHVEEVKGLGVVGHQPLLQPGEAFEYSSGSRRLACAGASRCCIQKFRPVVATADGQPRQGL